MSAGVPGQAPEMYVPPPEVQLAVARQTPGAPPEPVQEPFSRARSATTLAWMVLAPRRRMVGMRMEKCILNVE